MFSSRGAGSESLVSCLLGFYLYSDVSSLFSTFFSLLQFLPFNLPLQFHTLVDTALYPFSYCHYL